MTLTMDSPKLRELTRTQLQSLAEREIVPAIGKTDDIIRRLMQKHPRGVPVSEYVSPSPFSGELSPVSSSDHSSHGTCNENQDARSAAPAPEDLYPGWQAEEEEESDNAHDYGHVKGAPNRYMVVDALRQFTTVVNTIPTMETHIAESRCLLKRTESLLKKATSDARELTVTREYLETFLLAKMKKKPELWDGTGKMERQARKCRMEWLRAKRKVEDKKRWREANELNKQHGLDEESFSAFGSGSDEEVIESLRTTPTSSRSGGSKRAREKSGNAKLNVDSGGGGSRKNKATP